MRKNICIAIVASAFLAVSCGGNGGEKQPESKATPVIERLPGDSNVYGLMCDGGSDSVLYLVQTDGSDPVKYDITMATRRRMIMGSPQIGDWIAVVPNAKNKNVADMVVNLEELKGSWCHVVMPELRNSDDMTTAEKKRFLKVMPDSIRNMYLIPREYGFTLKRRFQASSIGWVRQTTVLEDESPVVYPAVPLYRQWHLLNGKLVLSRAERTGMPLKTDSVGKDKMPAEKLVNDTADIIMLKNDSLVLRFSGSKTQGYYRIKDANDANKEAIKKAEEIAKMAQEKLMDKDTIPSGNGKK
jgi:hypothetical protein